jgi:hypothetical protein
MKLLMELFSKKTALQVKLSCAKQALITFYLIHHTKKDQYFIYGQWSHATNTVDRSGKDAYR